MRYVFYTLFFALIFNCIASKAQDSTRYYQQAYEIIDSMLTGKTQLNFKKAVFSVENAYYNGKLDPYWFEKEIMLLKGFVNGVTKYNSLEYNESDKESVRTNAAIFRVLTDTIPIVFDSGKVVYHLPYTYDFNDVFGFIHWENNFVSKLLHTGEGNCHSLPFLYKIIAEEFHVPAYLSFAPSHIYIKSRCKKTGWYNTELTSATFPVDAWIMASGYVHLDAIRNGLYMDTLSLQQSVAYCLLDLAQGYQHKFGADSINFVVKCCYTVLKYHSVNVNAMLTKAEAQKNYIGLLMKQKNVKNPKDLFDDKSIELMYSEMEQIYVRLHQLGYRNMPEEMYLKWMGLLESEPEKYLNRKVIYIFDNP